MIRILIDGEYREGSEALFGCVGRYPGRWDETVIAYAATKLESEAWRRISTGDWPDVLDALDGELRSALPQTDRHRGSFTVH